MVERWEADAGLMTIGEAVLAALKAQEEDGNERPISAEEWSAFAKTASFWSVREKARELGIDFYWDADVARTPEGFYQVRGGLEYAIRKSLSVAPYADLIWMETATADIHEAQEFAEAIHAEFPDKMLAYNLSPSFNWDSTGMSDDEMRELPEAARRGRIRVQLHHLRRPPDRRRRRRGVRDGAARTTACSPWRRCSGRSACSSRPTARRRPTSAVRASTPRLAASSARTATTKAMGKGSTQVQHLVQTELPKKVLEDWLADWSEFNGIDERLTVRLRPSREGADLLELEVLGDDGEKKANVVFAPTQDRKGRTSCRSATRTRSTPPCARSG